MCGSHLCFQPAGTTRRGENSCAFYLSQFGTLGLDHVQIYNEGIHFEEARAKARADSFLRAFKALPREAQARVKWRETAPQHFATRHRGTNGKVQRDGAWPGHWYDTSKQPCAPLATTKDPWEGLARRFERSGCPVLRVWDLSAAFWNEHLQNRTPHTQRGGGSDCTHFW